MSSLLITNPATDILITIVDGDEPADVRAKYQAARAAQPGWAALPLADRLACLSRFRAELAGETPKLARILTQEVGKPFQQSLNELKGTLERLDFFLTETESALRDETVRLAAAGSPLTELITHVPLGVVANISAWNYPFFVGSNVFVPALLAGNAVLYKPSEFATLTGLAITRLLHASGVPKHVFAPVIGPGKIGEALLAQPVDGVFFTGSYATGRKIARRIAGRMIRLQLELGGKDPAYVCPDADLSTAAASLADGAFYNTGQSCCSVERIYVHEQIYAAFVDQFVAEVKKFRMGNPMKPDVYIGPLTRRPQIKVLDEQIADARRKGAKVLLGGQRRANHRGSYYQPTVLVDVNHRMKVMKEESFGPIIGIMPAKDDAHAIELMNDSAYGLTAAVYSRDEGRARTILSRVNSGTAYWNCCDRVSPRLPWSGIGHSGIGLTLSKYGIQTFTRPKAWHLREC